MFGDERVVVKYVQLCALFPPLALLRERKWYEVVSAIEMSVFYFHFFNVGDFSEICG